LKMPPPQRPPHSGPCVTLLPPAPNPTKREPATPAPQRAVCDHTTSDVRESPSTARNARPTAGRV